MTETLANFHFLRPLALLMWLPVIALGVLLWRHRNRTETWSQVIAPELLPYLLTGSPQKRSRSALPILIVAWCLATIGAAGPSWEQLPKPVLQKQDAMILLMDLSLSMLATDLAPSRADRVRRKLLDLLRERDEGLTALVAYAGDAHVVAPLTDDNPTIANLLPALNPTMMPLPGSDPVDAVRRAVELLDSAGVRRARLLLVTDGVTQGDVDGIADLLRNRPVQLMVMGVGTRSGAPIGLPEGGFLKNESGDIVVPKLEESVLRQLAAETSGQYRTMSVDDSDLELLLDTPFSMSDEDTIDLDRRADQWQDAAHWFVLPLLLVSLVSFRRGMVAALLVGILLPNQEAEAFEWQDLWLNADQQGKAALDAGDAEAAANLFTQNDWRAKAQFEAGDYETAGKTFGETATADGWYNRGNALAAQGELDKAITAYKKSLALQPESEDAQKNIETLEKLKEEQQQQQQQGNQGDQSQEQDGEQGQEGQNQQEQDGQQQQQGSQSQQQGQNQQDSQQQQQQQEDGQSPGQTSGSQASEPQQQEQEVESKTEQQSQKREQMATEKKAVDQPNQPSPEFDDAEMREDLERDQALQQWLRRVPDDPSGLLREKFRYESMKRRQQGERRDNKQVW